MSKIGNLRNHTAAIDSVCLASRKCCEWVIRPKLLSRFSPESLVRWYKLVQTTAVGYVTVSY